MTEIARVESHVALDGPFVRVYDDEVRFPSGRAGRHVRVEPATGHPGVVVLALHDSKICLVRVFRYPIGRAQWGLPRGFGDEPDPLVTAARELREETGLSGGRFEILAHVTPDSGIQSVAVTVVLATEFATVDSEIEDQDEVSEVLWVDQRDVIKMLLDDGPTDGFTLAALALLGART